MRLFVGVCCAAIWPSQGAAQTTPPSCDGLPATCGDGTEDCCETLLVPSGAFDLGRTPGAVDDCVCTGCDASCGGCGDLDCDLEEEPGQPALLSSFALDRFEVTVGRFRQWVEAGAPEPAAGTGLHTHLTGGQLEGETGWDEDWPIPVNFDTALFCATGSSLWTSEPGANEGLPINCVNWYEAYAFCIWDGGFLPTEAEWEHAASGGEERIYPWSTPPGSDVIDDSYASYLCLGDGDPLCGIDDLLPPGSRPAGAGRWGHDDLAGNDHEWVLDWFAGTDYPATLCNDCYAAEPASSRGLRGGAWQSQEQHVRAAARWGASPGARNNNYGFRCARPADAATVLAVVQGTVLFAGTPEPGVTVFADLDGDGVLDPGEPSDVSSEPNQQFPNGGGYRIEGIQLGDVDIRIVNPDPETLEVTSPAEGFYALTLFSGDVVSDLDFELDQAPSTAAVEGQVRVYADFTRPVVTEFEGVTIFADLDGDGVLDDGEPSDVSSDTGQYRIDGIPEGNVDIRAINPDPVEWELLVPASGVYNIDAQDEVVETGVVFVFAQLPPPAVVEGQVRRYENLTVYSFEGVTVFADLNGNGELDGGEPSDVSSDTGQYRIEGIVEGNVDIRAVNPDPAQWELAIPADGAYNVDAVDGLVETDVIFLFAQLPPPAVVEGQVRRYENLTVYSFEGVTVFADLNGNGELDGGEPSDVSSDTGQYRIEGIVEGNVDIRAVNPDPAQWWLAIPADGVYNVDAVDGLVETDVIFLFAQLPPPAVVEGQVRRDENLTVYSFEGVTVFADLNGNGELDGGEPSDVSSDTGQYRIEGIVEGNVDIRAINPDPAQWWLAIPADGVYNVDAVDGLVETDVIFLFAQLPPPAVVEGQVRRDENLTVYSFEGVTVFADLNGNGELDGGEPSDVSSDTGQYRIEGIVEGNVDIRAVNPDPAQWWLAIPADGVYNVDAVDGLVETDVIFLFAQLPPPAVVEGQVRRDENLTVYSFEGVTVFADLNGNGELDGGEPSDVSSDTGQYRIEGIVEGNVDIRAVNPDPAQWWLAIPADGVYNVDAVDGLVETDVIFLFAQLPPTSVEGVVRIVVDGTVYPAGGVTVFADLDGNGELDDGEPSTMTPQPPPQFSFGDGSYRLEGLPEGEVDIRIVNPAPDTIVVTEPEGGFHVVELANGTALTGIDFELEAALPPSVEGVVRIVVDGTVYPAGGITVFADLDGNGLLDDGEPSTVTDEAPPFFPFGGGSYRLEGIPVGTADIRIVNPAPGDLVVTTPEDGFYPVDLANNEVVFNADFELEAALPATVEGEVRVIVGETVLPGGGITVFADLDGNGLLDDGEPSTVTDEAPPLFPLGGGSYRLEGIPVGTADIRIVNPAPGDLVVTTPEDGFYPVDLANNEVVFNVDFELEVALPAAVEGEVRILFNDTVIPAGGVTVFADLDGNGLLDDGEPSTLTDEAPPLFPLGGGSYRLEGLPLGTADIRIVNPAPDDFTVTLPVGGSYPVNLANGDLVTGADFELEVTPPGAVVEGQVRYILDGAEGPGDGVTVYADLDGNGTFDDGEPAALSAEPNPLFPLSGGEYRIDGIPAGAVDILIVNPAPDIATLIEPAEGLHELVVMEGDVVIDLDFVFELTSDPDDPDGGENGGGGGEGPCSAVGSSPPPSLAFALMVLVWLGRRRR